MLVTNVLAAHVGIEARTIAIIIIKTITIIFITVNIIIITI
jgi:hypothetical protein